MLMWYSLTRRFSVLRNSAGEPIGLDEIKFKLAEQRARGSENRVSEEEEDMILEALSRLRTKGSTSRTGAITEEGDTQGERVLSGYTETGSRISESPSFAGSQSVQSTTTTSSVLHGSTSNASLSSAKGSQVGRRMSNNLFGSGKFHDQSYMRTAYQRRTTTSTGSRSSVKNSDSTVSMSTITSSRIGPHNSVYSDLQSLRPITPDSSSAYGSSAPSSPNRGPHERELIMDVRPDLSRTLVPEVLGRASLALDEVIRELEEEGDDEIVMERSPISPTALASPGNISAPLSETSPFTISPPISPADSEPGMAVSSDEGSQRASPFSRSSTTSPTPRLPGYIPGMPRPMTPHNISFDSDDQTPSATPRATSPRLPTSNSQPSPISQAIASGLHRSTSSASVTRNSRPVSPSTTSPVSTSPLFFHRSTNGRFTPEDRLHNGSGSDSLSQGDERPDSPVVGRHRPLSPLATPAYQSMTPVSISRPTTPSNITWTTPSQLSSPKSHGRRGSVTGQSVTGHNRNGSTVSAAEANGDVEHSRSSTRPLRSSVNPESPWHDSRHASSTSLGINADYRPSSAMSGTELNSSPVQTLNRSLRSPTPVHNNAYPSTSGAFADQGVHTNGNGLSPSRRTSKQNNHSSFSFTPSQTLLFSPLTNVSRSSLGSAGSSYHSWDEDHKQDRLRDLYFSLDPQPEWHDLSREQSPSSTSRTTPYEASDSEGAVREELGLNKSDVVTIQEKLVTAALTKAATPEGRYRANSVRRRRPSTSQSNYSFTGAEKAANPSQAPQSQSQSQSQAPATTAYSNRQVNSEQLAKANALLNAVVDSIQSPRNKPINITDLEEPAASTTHAEESVATNPSPSQKHRALADALFGTEDRQKVDAALPLPFTFPATVRISPPEKPASVTSEVISSDHVVDDEKAPAEPTEHVAVTLDEATPKVSEPNGHVDPTLLALDVQRRAEAATAALRKSPSIPKFSEGSSSTRKRIAREQISSPTLVSASTSVDTIPLTSINPAQVRTPAPPPTTLSARIKRLRGTLRAKSPQATGPETSRPSVELAKTPPSTQTITFNSLSPDAFSKDVLSANESTRFKISPPSMASPPASAGPGLKGFMSRFRKHKTSELLSLNEKREPTLSPSTTISSALTPTPQYSVQSSTTPESQSAPASRTFFAGSRPLSPPQLPMPSLSSSQAGIDIPAPASAPIAPAQSGEAALKQLFDAAHDLGLDESALSELLARSPSTASKSTVWTKSVRSNSVADGRQSQRTELRESTASPLSFDGRSSIDPMSSRPSTEIRQLTIRKNTEPSATTRPAPSPASKDPLATVIRRTIIIPSDSKATMDLNALLRKQSTSRRRQSLGGGSINSARSIQDRVPTPPPPRANASKRFSAGRSPPVPTMPSFAAHGDTIAPPAQMEKSNSTYESLYEMYAGDVRTPAAAHVDGIPSGSQSVQGEAGGVEAGAAVEVIELANGETIWSIVNGLRDDDAESFYDNRTSFTSEYSAEGVRVFFKEHARKSSKSSTTSLLSRKKQQGSASQRPETKVFFSSSAQIDRLIETLTRDKEAGSFNIAPNRQHSHLAHSASSSLVSTTDMLERMLGSMSASSS
ncbi:hypothetical protein BDY19DRAFT_995640 [Irpex rosettiformis]|uniref:Uncharacterized protein n=1 Tax=Irpex rosettiformis TaxID=378272 RepID=A0ACB8TX12_9APHY|nr:hypothetical protein BDY19DRAFT_995640 [Irpex rosettiformis]